jgi:hypothetical protein
MGYQIELILSILAITYLAIEIVRHFIFNNDKWALYTGVIAMLSFVFGIILCIKHGLILDYSTPIEIAKNKSQMMSKIGVALLLTSTLFIALSILYSFLERLGILKRKNKD